ncbi:thioredoxin fold domain-containing protein [Epibacterium sp. DP7N7-1]|nr:thioredoxin fold domain-containing protein [Epibacterium sp. DP7N7-1]
MKQTLFTVIACMLGSVAWSQGDDLQMAEASANSGHKTPTVFTVVPNLEQSGSISGMNTWVSPGTNVMFMQNPEDGTLIAGFPFDAEGKSLHPALIDKEGAGFDAMVEELFGPVVEIPDEYAPTVDEHMSAMSDEERSAALADLVERLSDVEGEAEFNAAVEGWIKTLQPPEDEASLGTDDANIDLAGAATSEGEGLSLIDGLRRSFTLQVGDTNAPLIYVITDPSCEACRATNDLLREKVEAGELQMRIVMIDVVNEDSLGTIAGIVTAANPAKTFLEMSADEDVEMPFARAAGIPADFMKGLEANYAMAEAFKIPQLPFVAFETEDGPAYISGAPAPEQLAAALPPSDADEITAEPSEDDSETEADEVVEDTSLTEEADPEATE